MAFVDAAPFSDLADGTPHVVRLGGREIVLLRWEDEVYAFKNVCPHQTQSFAGGQVRLRLTHGSRPGEIAVHRDAPILACPWHHWEFALDTGGCEFDPRLRIRTFAARVVDGRVEVDLQSKRAPAGAAG